MCSEEAALQQKYTYFNQKKKIELEMKVNPYPAKLIYLNFQPLEVVSRYHGHCELQLQVAENYSKLFNLSKNICKS